MTFAAIDLDGHQAQVIGNQGAADVYAARSVGSIFFIEQTPAGGVILTSVIDADVKGRIHAVTSRHIIAPVGFTLVSQTLGTCIAKN